MNNMQNTLFTNDNLYILNGLNSEIADLIYLDPPFNSKRIYSAPIGSKAAGASFKDMWTWKDVDEAYLDKIVEDYPLLVSFINSIEESHSKAMKAYVTYMTQRLIQLHRILKSTGSIYLHCDPTASHYLKLLMDFIFGKENFRNEIVWRRTVGAKGSQFKAKKFGASTDIILFYAKSENAYFRQTVGNLSDRDILQKFNKIDENGKKYYDDSAHIFCNPGMGARPNLCYEWRGFINPYASGWRLSKERLEEEYQKGNIVIREDGKLERRKYLDDYDGVPVDNNWIDIPRVGGKEATGYPTQKPLALLHRIIKASSKEGDLVLDPFCGCATTCVAAQQLNRKWIGIDIEKQAVSVLMDRLSDDAGLFSNFIQRTDVPQRTDVQKVLSTEKSVRERLFKEQNGKCKACDVEMRIVDFEVDHIIPKAKGGGDYYENYQLLCASCNRIKGARPMEYLRLKIQTREKYIKKIQFGE